MTPRCSFAPVSRVTACRSVSFRALLTFAHSRASPRPRISVHLGARTPEQFPTPSSPHVALQRSASTPPLPEGRAEGFATCSNCVRGVRHSSCAVQPVLTAHIDKRSRQLAALRFAAKGGVVLSLDGGRERA
eukprot:scaffold39258_cov67-Phaeocystis_antarctica.AAC.1